MDSPDLSSPQDTTTIPRGDPLGDVFGSDGGDFSVFEEEDGRPHSQIRTIRQDGEGSTPQHHPTDMHRLQQEHTTAGYRDGVTAAKASSIQAGFDEGFGLGATIGLRVGRLLGVLEGIAGAAALRADGPSGPEAEDASRLLSDARADLGVRSVFSEAFWNADGTWKYDVGEGEGVDGASVVLFPHVAEAHPLVRKWTATVEAQMRKWGLQEQVHLLLRREDEDGHVAGPMARAKATTQSQAEAKAPSDALSW